MAFHRDFKPEKGDKTYATAITVGVCYFHAFIVFPFANVALSFQAGVQFSEFYAFADANNVTVLGGKTLACAKFRQSADKNICL